MIRRFASLLVILLTLTGPVYGGCAENPTASTFAIANDCSFAHPCLEDEAHTLNIQVYGCLHWWDPCKPFTFSSCDTVTWDFGDGQIAVVAGSAKISHTWANPGSHTVRAFISNSHGTRELTHTFTSVRKPPVFVTWAADSYEASEKDGSLTLTLHRSGDPSRAVTLLLSAGSQFDPAKAWDRTIESIHDRPITIPAGVTSLPVTIQLRDDPVYLGPQTYFVTVFDDSGESVLPEDNRTARATVSVADDDPAPVLTVHDITVDEGDGRQVIRIPHVLSEALPKSFSLWWYNSAGTATPRVDWDSPQGGAYYSDRSFEAGQTSMDLEVVILGDTKAEGDETIVLDIATGSAPVILSQPTITITIRDDDEIHNTNLTFTTSEARLEAYNTTLVTLQTNPPMQTTATLTASPAGVVEVPARVELDAAGRATFLVQGLQGGEAQITAVLSPDYGSAAATLPVTVTEPVAEEPRTPEITGLTPAAGPATGGTAVAIAGNDLTPDCSVTFGGTPAASLSWRDEHALTAVTPRHEAGMVDVRLTCGDRSFLLEQGYRFTAAKRRAAR